MRGLERGGEDRGLAIVRVVSCSSVSNLPISKSDKRSYVVRSVGESRAGLGCSPDKAGSVESPTDVRWSWTSEEHLGALDRSLWRARPC